MQVESAHDLGFRFDIVYYISTWGNVVLYESKRKGAHYVYTFRLLGS